MNSPFDSPLFLENWKDWETFRKEIKKPLTPTAIKKQFKFLSDMTEDQAIACLEQSMRNSWCGLFPVAKAITNCKTVHFAPTEGGGW